MKYQTEEALELEVAKIKIKPHQQKAREAFHREESFMHLYDGQWLFFGLPCNPVRVNPSVVKQAIGFPERICMAPYHLRCVGIEGEFGMYALEINANASKAKSKSEIPSLKNLSDFFGGNPRMGLGGVD